MVFKIPLEAMVWLIGLSILAIYNPHQQQHMTMCVFDNLGFAYCPGCGLGRSISFLFHGDLLHSISTHPLGIPAILILVYRILISSIDYIKRLKLKY